MDQYKQLIKSMDVCDTAHSINPNNFPGKLWRLVHHPGSVAIRWDASGEVLVIFQALFEQHFLAATLKAPGGGYLFKTTNFTSFIRQLNLYGFRKVVSSRMSGGGGGGPAPRAVLGENGLEHRFCHPHFRRGRPELLVNLRRLTSNNKAKLKAGLEVYCRPPRHFPQSWTGNIEDKVEKRAPSTGAPSLGQTTQPAPARPCVPSRPQPGGAEYGRAPVPSRGWLLAEGGAPCIPIPVLHRYPGGGGGGRSPGPAAAARAEQGAPAPGAPGQTFYNLIAHAPQYQPAFYSPAYNCYLPGAVSSDVTGPGNQTSPYSHLSYYQPNGTVGLLYPGNHNQDLQIGENQDLKKSDLNLDAVFQIIDEFQPPPRVCMVKVEAAEEPGPPAGPLTSIHGVAPPAADGTQRTAHRGSSTDDMKPIKEEMIEEPFFRAPLNMHNHALVKVSRDKTTELKASSALKDAGVPKRQWDSDSMQAQYPDGDSDVCGSAWRP